MYEDRRESIFNPQSTLMNHTKTYSSAVGDQVRHRYFQKEGSVLKDKRSSLYPK
jgi:hypothetical protein